MFLRDHAPDVIPELSRGLALATVRCSCEYFAELAAFEEVIVRMSLAELVQKTASDSPSNTGGRKAAPRNWLPAGEASAKVACMRQRGGALRTTPVRAAALRQALADYTA